MNLSETPIAIRERGFDEVMDLALHVFRRHWWQLLVVGLFGILPWAGLNYGLMSDFEFDEEWSEEAIGYSNVMFLLVLFEAPLATAPLTLYLGQATFARSVSYKKIATDFFKSLPQLILLQVIWRGILAVLFFLPLVISIMIRPYVSELILLERNAFWAGRTNRLTTTRRVSTIHRHVSNMLISRWFATIGAGAVLFGALLGGVLTIIGLLSNYAPSVSVLHSVIVPIVMWLVFVFLTVVRFLAYLDLRIRREGWEVDLNFRAEAERLRREFA